MDKRREWTEYRRGKRKT